MKEYLFIIVCVAAVDLLTYFLSGTTNNNGFDRYIKVALKLCMLSVIIYPIVGKESLESVLNRVQIEETYKSETELSENSMYILEVECEEKLSEYIFEYSGIKPEYVSIQIEKKESDSDIRIKSVRIKMPENFEGEKEQLNKIIMEAIRCETEIIYGD